jgi:Asp/Glu/hydantoin racemase
MLAKTCAAAADEDGADQIILGGAALAGLAEQIQPRVWAPVLDSVLVGAQRAAALARAPRAEAGDSAAPIAAIGVGAELARLLR